MLRSSQPSYLKFEKPPEVSELDHRHKLQMKLLSLVRRCAKQCNETVEFISLLTFHYFNLSLGMSNFTFYVFMVG